MNVLLNQMEYSNIHSGDDHVHVVTTVFIIKYYICNFKNLYDSDNGLYFITAAFALLVQTSAIAFLTISLVLSQSQTYEPSTSPFRQFDVKRYHFNIRSIFRRPLKTSILIQSFFLSWLYYLPTCRLHFFLTGTYVH